MSGQQRKSAIVTGGGSGIRRATVLALRRPRPGAYALDYVRAGQAAGPRAQRNERRRLLR